MKNNRNNWIYGTIVILMLFFIAIPVLYKIEEINSLASQFYGALTGVAITAIITVFLLQGQTSNEEMKEQNVRVFEKKSTIFNEFIENLWKIWEKKDISMEEIRELIHKISKDIIPYAQPNNSKMILHKINNIAESIDTDDIAKKIEENMLDIINILSKEIGLGGELNAEIKQELNILETKIAPLVEKTKSIQINRMKYRNINFAPWIGKYYDEKEDNKIGKKILILEQSLYLERLEGDIERGLKEGKYMGITQNKLDLYIKYKKGEGEFEPWMNQFTKLASVFIDEDNGLNQIDVLESIMYHTYVQTPMFSGTENPAPRQYKESEEIFYDIIEKSEPDLIIVLGLRLWDNMPDKGRWAEDSNVKGGGGLYYYDIKGKEYPAIVLMNPSHPTFSKEDVKAALSEI